MPRKKPTTGKEISHENCVTKKLSTQREKDFKALAKAKAQEKGKSFKKVPIFPRGFKLVEITK